MPYIVCLCVSAVYYLEMYNTITKFYHLRRVVSELLLVKYEYLDMILYHGLVYFPVIFLGLIFFPNLGLTMMYIEVT